MKRAQITLFIAVSLFVLFIFAFLLYVKFNVFKISTEKQRSRLVETTQLFEPMKFYVDACLEDALSKGLYLVGRQGGFIFQDGIVDDLNVTTVEHEIYNDTKNISVLISAPKLGSIVHYPPIYPCYIRGAVSSINDSLTDQLCYTAYDHNLKGISFGVIGEKKYGIKPDLETTDSCSGVKCNYTIQKQLEKYIEFRMKTCINVSYVKSELGMNVELEEPRAQVSFASERVYVDLQFPVNISVANETAQEIGTFKAEKRVRLKEIYDLVRDGITRDVIDITYDINDIERKSDQKGLNLVVTKLYLQGYSIIIVNDSTNKLDGDDYLFIFARENRPPALNYYITTRHTEWENKYHILSFENDTLEITPLAYDPDEDTIFYKYSGWKSDWDDIWNGTIQDVTRIMPYNHNDWEESDPYLNGDLGCESQKNRCAEYTLRKKDIGWHNLTINVTDGRLQDSQLIKIFVDDKPHVEFKVHSIYPAYFNTISIEDPIILNASGTYAYFFKDDLKLDWTETLEQFYLEDGPAELIFPEEDFNIMNRKDFIFKVPVPHTFRLDVSKKPFSQNFETVLIEKEFQQCIPYRSDVAPFPFNMVSRYVNDSYDGSYSGDYSSFFTNHTCCDDSGYNLEGTECYNVTEYGCIDDFMDDYDMINNVSFFGDVSYYDGSDPVTFGNASFVRRFIGQCGGMSTINPARGNICYPVNYSIEKYDDCSDPCFRCKRGVLGCTEIMFGDPGFDDVCNDEFRRIFSAMTPIGPGAVLVYPDQSDSAGYFCCQGACGDNDKNPPTIEGYCNRPINCVNCWNLTLYNLGQTFHGCNAYPESQAFSDVCRWS